MTYATIELAICDHVAILTLNQPASRNGLTETLQQEVLAGLKRVEQERKARALIITGAGKSFCSGADLGRIGDTSGSDSLGNRVSQSMEELSNPIILAIRNLSVPVVAAVNGAAAGAGISIALAADVVVAARSAFFLTPFLPRLGIVPDMGATWFLPHHLGRARALGLMLLGDRLPAQTAQEWGLIWSCVEDEALMKEARGIAARLSQLPAHAALEARAALHAALGQDLPQQLDYERQRQKELIDLPSFQEGVRAFFEKREPVFARPGPEGKEK
ncbi:enoyl-CoA hydratase-related protein [Noviherbaspirillum pedocola]|uniref:Enoyl-CoA hydratase/isomerase family protein n=1 Tax=Noviherbaspirillum pedocola TaxID=2801341 RepID=A0A934SY65_9BURK|nr:enoyl-CoA hydratase-related protein [Noviherbaspirillum pedocola]MBK4738720.1 enoyl-CoA hydratase/isomerase family protein [Noviherbaspirillum pedocola]